MTINIIFMSLKGFVFVVAVIVVVVVLVVVLVLLSFVRGR